MPQDSGAQALPDFQETLLATFDHLKAAGDIAGYSAWIKSLHGDDLDCLAMALGKRALAKLGCGEVPA